MKTLFQHAEGWGNYFSAKGRLESFEVEETETEIILIAKKKPVSRFALSNINTGERKYPKTYDEIRAFLGITYNAEVRMLAKSGGIWNGWKIEIKGVPNRTGI